MRVYIIAHKEVDLPKLPPIYMPLQVGTSLNGKIMNNWECDNTGEQISEKNKCYNELTGVYWIWKNCTEDIVGICHYRRFFVTFWGKVKNLVTGCQSEFLTEEKIKRMLKNHDMIVHNKTFFGKGCGRQFQETQKHPEDLQVLREVIQKKCPDYIESYDKMLQSKTCHLLNVMITRKEVFDDYCQWLFYILFDVEENLKDKGENNFDRRMGMLGERLLDVWIIHNHIRIKECMMLNTERKDWKPW